MHNSVVKISSKKSNCLGTGFVIDKADNGIYVATCNHVISKCKDNILINGNESELVKTGNTGLDLAIVYVPNLNIEPLSILKDNTSTSATVIGYSKLLNNPKKEPIRDIELKHEILLETPNKINIMKLYTKEAISNGYSGSPVICQNSNNVIGIVNIQEGDNTNYAICSSHLQELYPKDIKTKTSEKETSKIYKKKHLDIDEINYQIIKQNLTKIFEKSLELYNGQPKIWLEPKLHTMKEESHNICSVDNPILITDLINTPRSVIINAREQYGLTSTSHFLVKEAWVLNKKPSLWLRLDANKIKPYKKEIEKYIKSQLKEIGMSEDDVECYILDEFSSSMKDANKLFNLLSEILIDKPIIIMYTDIDNPLLNEEITIPKDRTFETYYLWSLPRNKIRQIVSSYNNEKKIGDENDIVNKIVTDLEVLNVPRTVLNCLTMLKIFEYNFDESPVNRTEMLSRILSLLFNVNNIPRYKTRPDLKDTEYTLGYFCELLIKNNYYLFSRDKFIHEIKSFCIKMEIELEVEVIFDILYENNIIIERGTEFCFKFSYWIFYFAAQRMHKNPIFSEFMLNDMNYSSYPEIIEFYTGIERNRDSALKILTNDLKEISKIVDEKCRLPNVLNIYDYLLWKPNEQTIKDMNEEISEGILSSNLPDVVKDEYADKSYNSSRPLNQSIHKILEEYSLLRLMKILSAASKALRNSDYVDPKVKHELLKTIIESWSLISKVLLAITPILAKNGIATLDGATFSLDDNFGNTIEERIKNIIYQIPSNIVEWHSDDLFSKKMSSLLFNHIKEEEDKTKKHFFNLLLIIKKPNKWYEHIEKYVIEENKNSYYLLDLYENLRAEYRYSFSSRTDLSHMEKLIKVIATKHYEGIKKPSRKVIEKFEKQNRFENIMPHRESKDS